MSISMNKLVRSALEFGRQNSLDSRLCCQVRPYSEAVHDHFGNPRNVGSLDKSDPNVGTAFVGKAACGDVIKLSVRVENGTIEDAKFKTFGCGSAIASSSLATEMIKGKTIEQALGLKNTEIAEHLSLPPVKIHCSLLAEDAVRHAIEDYKKKEANRALEQKAVADNEA